MASFLVIGALVFSGVVGTAKICNETIQLFNFVSSADRGFAGIAIQRLPRKLGHFLVFLALAAPSVVVLEQQAYQVFTANSRALVAFAEQHPKGLFRFGQ